MKVKAPDHNFFRLHFHFVDEFRAGKELPEIPPNLPFPKGGEMVSPFEKGGPRGISEVARQFGTLYKKVNSTHFFYLTSF
jgi:hypothetical protein